MSMILKVGESEDTFSKDEENPEFAYKDKIMYDVLVSSKIYLAGGCIGKMKIVIDNNEVLHWIYPLMSGGEYEIFDLTKINRLCDIIDAYDTAIGCREI